MNTTNDATAQESAELEFKTSFNPKHEWCELIKDIVAMANSGGGRILVGVKDDGSASNADITQLFDADLADIINRICAYTDVNFSAFTISPLHYDGTTVAEISIQSAATLLVFGKSGNYADSQGKQKCAFNPGTLYVRHGPKSEPATTDDLRTIIQRNVDRDRQSLLVNLRQVIEAPANAVLSFVASVSAYDDGTSAASEKVRIVDSLEAKPAILLDPNSTHPYRQKEVVDAISKHFGGRIRFTTNDNHSIRKLHEIKEKREYFYKPKTGSGQYSDAYVSWVINQIETDGAFLTKIRKASRDSIAADNIRRKATRYV